MQERTFGHLATIIHYFPEMMTRVKEIKVRIMQVFSLN
jgi:hypothetical protein